ncbi:hypothetical protein M3649_03880 [Ureibacillus chungkukjangi]|uniref:hypothetical protein n=1 Tax=Ureibacillus chungkukjangi TaxID=1202712 RepID=UPI00203D3979|nr:hypothetical protein [Ureibacillus chungkukjangi]MCM3387271.1 hypothetical protein [Ureibacillus chungkukjangi]
MLEELFNGKFTTQVKTERIAIGLVYNDDGRNQGQARYYKTRDLENHLSSVGYDLDSVDIIPMENERILGVENIFVEIYYSDDIPLSLYRKLLSKFSNVNEF